MPSLECQLELTSRSACHCKPIRAANRRQDIGHENFPACGRGFPANGQSRSRTADSSLLSVSVPAGPCSRVLPVLSGVAVTARRPPRHCRFQPREIDSGGGGRGRSVWPGRRMQSRTGRMRSGHAGCWQGSRASCTGVSPGVATRSARDLTDPLWCVQTAQPRALPLLRHPAGPAGDAPGPAPPHRGKLRLHNTTSSPSTGPPPSWTRNAPVSYTHLR
jgi:hypothetical protein